MIFFFEGLNQPGFLTNHNYLIPWDIVVNKGSTTNTNEKPGSLQASSRRNQSAVFKKNSTKLMESSNLWSATESFGGPITVRAYIGMEYECPCGHRFICSGPDRIVKANSSGIVKVITEILKNELNFLLIFNFVCKRTTPIKYFHI